MLISSVSYFFYRCRWFHRLFTPATSYKILIFVRVFVSSVRLRDIGTAAVISTTDIIYCKACFTSCISSTSYWIHKRW